MFLLLLAAAIATTPTVPAVPAVVLPDGTSVQVELATNDQQRALGLMFRDVLPADRGMLFVFGADEIYPFWMKDTFVALDMVWLDGTGKVVEVREHVQPCKADPCPSYTPLVRARLVLELAAGVAKPHGVKAGAMLKLVNVPGYPIPRAT